MEAIYILVETALYTMSFDSLNHAIIEIIFKNLVFTSKKTHVAVTDFNAV